MEDEAVVAATLKQYKGYIQLEKVELPGFRFREGLTNWCLMIDNKERKEDESYFFEYESYNQVPADKKEKPIKETMFANHYDQDILNELPKCLRVFPHDQNTSGFFITIFKKIKEFDEAVDDSKSKNPQKEESKGNGDKVESLLPLTI
jgi:16S rRNA C967 or C1407 C5-methylase (RsmB/RsmF family)